MSAVRTGAVGTAVERRDARAKVTGQALYALDHPVEDATYAAVVQARAARGFVTGLDPSAALELPGVLAFLSHENAPRLNRVENGELYLFQEPRVAYYGQIVAAVVAERPETALEAAALVRVEIDAEEHDVVLHTGHAGLYRPEQVAHRPVESARGDVAAAAREADVVVDATYATPAQHNMPMASSTAWSAAASARRAARVRSSWSPSSRRSTWVAR